MFKVLSSLLIKPSQALVDETSLSRFVHRATSEEKRRIYNRVIRQAAEEQRALLNSHHERSSKAKALI
ncbi:MULTISPECIES: hypothetical protein [Delftia]|uniref:hypothetical protein n=1 Tax=Delftia TaxID=80865 RepID=UPI000F84D275|nr:MULTISPECIES: hypothetical protein [Delftia]KAA9181984.1 hypothetical protein F3K36_00075 [Delftia sp. BR1]WEL96967.1 hypothetical protein PW274_23265 [Delftia tsuruhatensis]WQM84897.1 hypothetical protein RNT40_08600 [Delftia tsuruhatensis]